MENELRCLCSVSGRRRTACREMFANSRDIFKPLAATPGFSFTTLRFCIKIFVVILTASQNSKLPQRDSLWPTHIPLLDFPSSWMSSLVYISRCFL